MKPVLQQEATGCGIASVATLARVTYKHAQHAAAQFGISAEDDRLWSATAYVRTLLCHYGLRAADEEQPFHSWETLPDLALLAIKWPWSAVVLFGIGWCFGAGRVALLYSIQSGRFAPSAYGFRSHEAEVVDRNFKCHANTQKQTHSDG